MRKYSTVSDDARNRVISNWEQNEVKPAGKLDVLKEPHQKRGIMFIELNER